MSAESDLNLVLRNLNAVVIEMTEAGQAAAVEIGELLVQYARTHHLWQPETGKTDLTTQAVIEEVNGLIEVALTTETDYATFLELAREGRLAWLWPAMEANKAVIVEIMRRRLGRKRREAL